MKLFHYTFIIIPLLLAGCFPSKDGIHVTNAYMFATPKTFPAAAIFMTLENYTDTEDRMIDFRTDRAGRTELHTMETVNDIMKMRRVEGYDVPVEKIHTLKPMADHIMVIDMLSDFTEGEKFQGIAVFEKAGEIPVTVTVKSREDMAKHMH